MCSMPERKKEPVHEEFFGHFNELENDLLNIQQLFRDKKMGGASFDTISKELSSLKEDALGRVNNMTRIYTNNSHLFPAGTDKLLKQCLKYINEVHPDDVGQEKWSFSQKWLNEFKRNLGY